MGKVIKDYLPLLLFLFPLLILIPSSISINYAYTDNISYDDDIDIDFGDIENIDGDYENADRYANEFGKDDDEGLTKSLSGQYSRYKRVVVFVFGIATLTLVGCFMIFLLGLSATSGTNVMARSNAIKRLILCAIGTAIMGSFTLIFGIAFNIFR